MHAPNVARKHVASAPWRKTIVGHVMHTVSTRARRGQRGPSEEAVVVMVLGIRGPLGRCLPRLQSAPWPRIIPSQQVGLWRGVSASARRCEDKPRPREHRYQYNYDIFAQEPDADVVALPLVGKAELEKSKKRPRSCRMLTRDFIHDSLYNPHYGYFTRQAVLLPETDDAPTGFPFNGLKNEADFMRAVQERYMAFEQRLQETRQARARIRRNKDEPSVQEQLEALEERQRKVGWGTAESLDIARKRGRLLKMQSDSSMEENEVDAMAAGQVWHTPTQLFKPYYGRALARYLVAEYKLNLFPQHNLVLYELGGGSGALAQDILDYIEESEPDVYPQLQYRIVEISPRLAQGQRARLERHFRRGIVEIVNRDFLQWNEDVREPCFVIALEVLDNLTHDVVRYSTRDFQPYQGSVAIDETGDMHELWEPVNDPLILRYLDLLAAVRPAKTPPGMPSLLGSLPASVRHGLHDHMPFYPNLSKPHYLPTGTLQLFDVLQRHFPMHRLVVSDFSTLPDTIPGVNAPVVQTRHKGTMIPVTTYCVLQGFFDIFFPTNFDLLRAVYKRVMSAPTPQREEPETVAEAETLDASVLDSQPSGGNMPERYFNSSFTQSSSSAVMEDASRWLYEDYSQPPPDYVFSNPFFASDILPPSLLAANREARVLTHAEFLEWYAETDATKLRDSSNPMVSWYANACWFLT